MKLKDYGWVWEGQGFDPGVYPSIYGLGEGAEYFGIERICYMFHENSEFAMRKINRLKEIVCDISKWNYCNIDDPGNPSASCGVVNRVDCSFDTIFSEAKKVCSLSAIFSNITGAIHDDMRVLTKRSGLLPESYAPIYNLLHDNTPKLNLWSVIYSHELNSNEWINFSPYMDIINLWIWDVNDLINIDKYIKQCKEIFPDKKLIMGCYLRDYPSATPVSMDLVKYQWERVLNNIVNKLIDGYAILGTVLIDRQQEQAGWIRDFIKAN